MQPCFEKAPITLGLRWCCSNLQGPCLCYTFTTTESDPHRSVISGISCLYCNRLGIDCPPSRCTATLTTEAKRRRLLINPRLFPVPGQLSGKRQRTAAFPRHVMMAGIFRPLLSRSSGPPQLAFADRFLRVPAPLLILPVAFLRHRTWADESRRYAIPLSLESRRRAAWALGGI
jgi:hypothetical protein